MITTAFFDIGGVLLTNAWDHDQRAQAVRQFGLDRAEFEALHGRLGPAMERGEIGLDDYLRQAIFAQPRAFTPAQFREYMYSLSQPLDGSLDLLAGIQVPRVALNNEGRDLNQYRIDHFQLGRHFAAFCSSCYLGARKPDAEIYRRALAIMQAPAPECLFVDDREENLAAPRALGVDCVLFRSTEQLRQELAQRELL